MSGAAVGAFFKSIIPGIKNLAGIGNRVRTTAAAGFRGASPGVGSRLAGLTGGARDQARLSWNLASQAERTSMRNAGIALGAGAGALAINRGGAEARGA